MKKLIEKFVAGIITFVFISFFIGCSVNSSDIEVTHPNDSDGEISPPNESPVEIILPTGAGFLIEYYDIEKKGYLMLEPGGEEHKAVLKDTMSLEILSFMDDLAGLKIIEPKNTTVFRNYFGIGEQWAGDRYKPDTTIFHYTLKYKVPSIMGESIEEIKAVFHLYNPYYGKITEAWYNGKVIPIITWEEIDALYPPEGSDDRYDRDVNERIMKETYYSGDLVGVVRESCIDIVIPIKKQ